MDGIYRGARAVRGMEFDRRNQSSGGSRRDGHAERESGPGSEDVEAGHLSQRQPREWEDSYRYVSEKPGCGLDSHKWIGGLLSGRENRDSFGFLLPCSVIGSGAIKNKSRAVPVFLIT